jgi:hypothetical protein
VADIPEIDIPDLQLVDPPGTAPAGATLRRMVDVIKGKSAPPPPTEPDVSAAFGRGAQLVFEGEPAQPIFPKNPVPSGSRKAKPAPYRTTSRPPGAEDLQGLFATGLILLLVFAVGEWATPTAEEASAIAAPMANILARRIDLAAKLGRDASDTIALTVAILAYLARVGPIAAERVREGIDNRRRRERVVRGDGAPIRPDDSEGTGGMAAGYPNEPSANGGPAYRPFDALAQARSNGLGILDRDLGPASNTGSPVDADRP